MKENNYFKTNWEQSPNSKKNFKIPFCAAVLSCFLSGVVSADAPPAALDANANMPVLSHQAATGAVITSPSSEMPALSAEPVEIYTTPGPAPEVSEQVLPPELVQTDSLLKYESSTKDESVQPNMIAASFTPSDYGIQSDAVSENGFIQVSAENANDAKAVVGHSDDQMNMPYALVLALIAIIGLVPVSRRNL